MPRPERTGHAGRAGRALLLLAALIGLYATVQLAEALSPHLPGVLGEIFRKNRAADRRAGAYFYSEVEPVSDYLRRASPADPLP